MFHDEVSGHTAPLVNLEREEATIPKVSKVPSFALAIRLAVTDYLRHLQSQGIIEPAEHFQWACRSLLR